jgi:hypothetical protein
MKIINGILKPNKMKMAGHIQYIYEKLKVSTRRQDSLEGLDVEVDVTIVDFWSSCFPTICYYPRCWDQFFVHSLIHSSATAQPLYTHFSLRLLCTALS